MPNDVFGRPMDLTTPASKVNKNTVAPNPISEDGTVGAQNDPMTAMRGYGANGNGGSQSSAFHSGENSGAAYKIKSSHPGPIDTNTSFGPSGPGGYQLPACIKR